MIHISIYDMDRTITRRGTYAAFLTHMALATAPWRLLLLPFVGLVMLAYVLKGIDRRQAKEWNQWLMMGHRVSRDAIQAHVERYADRVIARNIRPGALAQIAADRAEGAVLVIASASYRLYVEPIARRLGFDHVIATDHMTQGSNYLRARIAGENCYDSAKLRMIEAWMIREGFVRDGCFVRAYSDHVSDAPMLDYADEAYAANPHAPLRKLAAERGWPVVEWG
ncbi:HAD-IB family hydrolase [Sphingobium sufflavum]|uniref:HAD family hydrolase n=1 Tax=Sphingobium sufflavum TaxID=1129547 RepID=UPI001F4202A5|nr:HAD-IB family hydrolase [Sphingobium sufflavum]MCE7795189.1 HAD-IB family hydrolase [Sphingobium sufflavum]